MRNQFNGGSIAFPANDAGGIGPPQAKEPWLKPQTLRENRHKTDHRFQLKTQNYKTFSKKCKRTNSLVSRVRQRVLDTKTMT